MCYVCGVVAHWKYVLLQVKTLYDCDATALLNVYIYLVFVGEGYLALVPSHLPHLRELALLGCDKVCDEYVNELVAAVPELEVATCEGDTRNKHLKATYDCRTSGEFGGLEQHRMTRSFRRLPS